MKKSKDEIIVKFPSKELKELFLASMMDGFGEGYYDFHHWTQEGKEYVKKYDEHGRLICYCDSIGDE